MNHKQFVAMLAHKLKDLAYESHNINALAAHSMVKSVALKLNISPYELAKQVHMYRNSFSFQKRA